MSHHNIWQSYNYPPDIPVSPTYVQTEPIPSSSGVNENERTLNSLQQQSSNFAAAAHEWSQNLEAQRKCTELLTELASVDNPLAEESIKGVFKKVAARRRKTKRGTKIFACPYCDYVCTPGGRDNMMHHLNGYKRCGYFYMPCSERMKAKPAVKGVFEKLEPIDVTDQKSPNPDSGNCSPKN